MKYCSNLRIQTDPKQLSVRTLLSICLSFVALACCQTSQEQTSGVAPIKIGVIADVQYADRPDGSKRHYRSAPEKLDQAIAQLNNEQAELVLHLGDFIDKDWESFDVVLPISDQSKAPFIHLLGNHDFSVANEYKAQIPEKLKMPARYYRFDHKGWRFLILDGNDLSLYAWPDGSDEAERSASIHADRFPDGPHWNGGIGSAQLGWLSQELDLADATSTPVILLNHFPIFPEDKHNLWNADEVLTLIAKHTSVKAWFNGHNHDGHYGEHAGIHFVTFRGLVDTSETAFATVELSEGSIEINGVGREPDRSLKLKPN